MRSYVLPDSDYSSLHHDLFFDFKVELPIFLNQKEKFFRISVQAYNENSDLERLIEAIEKLI
jgi:selenocysteine lyase/cysteine desulfurase